MVDGAKRRVSCTLPDGSRLPWHACNVNAIKTREQHGGTLSSSVFIQTMCLRSWIDARVIKVPSNRAKVAADIEKALGDGAIASVAVIFDQIAVEQDHWEDEVLDDGVVELMNSQFERFVLEAEIM
jgi:hypothetical protein